MNSFAHRLNIDLSDLIPGPMQYGTGVDIEDDKILLHFSKGDSFNLSLELTEDETDQLISHLVRRLGKLRASRGIVDAETKSWPPCDGCG